MYNRYIYIYNIYRIESTLRWTTQLTLPSDQLRRPFASLIVPSCLVAATHVHNVVVTCTQPPHFLLLPQLYLCLTESNVRNLLTHFFTALHNQMCITSIFPSRLLFLGLFLCFQDSSDEQSSYQVYYSTMCSTFVYQSKLKAKAKAIHM